MGNEESKQNPEQPNVERREQPQEETKEIWEAELPPTPQDIDMPPVKPPKEESGE